jgi:hypothetical protein
MEVEGKASATTDSVPRHLPPSHLAQADWDEVYQEKEPGSFWVSFRPSGAPPTSHLTSMHRCESVG